MSYSAETAHFFRPPFLHNQEKTTTFAGVYEDSTFASGAIVKLNGMKQIEVVAAIIRREERIFATQRGYGDWKDWWEFPGGKMEAGETPEEALRREIREELSTEISVDELLCTVDYDYPKFHLTMHCFLCSLLSEALHLNEHEAARWLSEDELDSVQWLPADQEVIRLLKRGGSLNSHV